MRFTNGYVITNPQGGGISDSEIELISVLKGKSFPAGTKSTLLSQRWPFQGEAYLIFAASYDGTTCTAYEDYRVVPLGH